MDRTTDSATPPWGRLFRTGDARISTAYRCFAWSLALRACWLAFDLGLLPHDEQTVIPLMFTLVAVPLADLLGCGAAITRPREARLLLMALAVALFWSRGLLWPQGCAPSWPPYNAWEAAPRLCQGIANGACVAILAAAFAAAMGRRRD